MPNLSPTVANAHVNPGALLLDMRELDEWQSGHVSGAVHLPLGDLATRIAELAHDREIVVMCLGGRRSQVASGMLARAGFGLVSNLDGGNTAWVRDGLPAVRG